MRSFRWMVLGIMLLSLPWAFADTVHLKDGSSLDGKVTRSDETAVVVEIGTGRMTLPAGDVASVERNDKHGDPQAVATEKSRQHQTSLDQRTGLTVRQRDAVRDVVEGLWSPDEAQRNAARKKLVAMGKEMPVSQYIESTLPYSKDLIVPELLKTLVELDPQRAKTTVYPYTQNPDPVNRISALGILGAYGKDDDLETLSRGLVDLDPNVRRAAAHAVAQAKGKRATPALIDALNNTDPKMHNAARAALKEMWSSENAEVDFATADEWRTFWGTRAAAVKNAIDPAQLTPLVTREDMALFSPTHDE